MTNNMMKHSYIRENRISRNLQIQTTNIRSKCTIMYKMVALSNILIYLKSFLKIFYTFNFLRTLRHSCTILFWL